MRAPIKKSFQDLKITGLDTDRSHAIAGTLIRTYFRLSGPPPLGWSYTFKTVWEVLDNPLKRRAGIEGEAIWIECTTEELANGHLRALESTVKQTNARFRDGARQRALNANSQTASDAQLRS